MALFHVLLFFFCSPAYAPSLRVKTEPHHCTGENCGRICSQSEIEWFKDPDDPGCTEHVVKWQIHVMGATDLPDTDIGSLSDPYVEVYVRSHLPNKKVREFKAGATGTIRNNLNPKWTNAIFDEVLLPETRSNSVIFKVFDMNRMLKDDFLGRCEVEILPVSGNGVKVQSQDCLLDIEPNKPSKNAPAAKLSFKISPMDTKTCHDHNDALMKCHDGQVLSMSAETTVCECKDIHINLYDKKNGQDEVLTCSTSYGDALYGVSLDIGRQGKDTHYLVASNRENPNLQHYGELRIANNVVKLETTSSTTKCNESQMKATKKEKFSVPNGNKMVNILISEVILSEKAWSTSMRIVVWLGPYIMLETRTSGGWLKQLYHWHLNELLSETNGNSGFESIVFELMNGNVRVGASRAYAFGELFSIVSPMPTRNIDELPTRHEEWTGRARIPRKYAQLNAANNDQWHINDSVFFQGEIMLYDIKDVLTVEREMLGLQDSDDSGERMRKWANTYGQPLGKGTKARRKNVFDYASDFNIALKKNKIIRRGTVLVSIALTNGANERCTPKEAKNSQYSSVVLAQLKTKTNYAKSGLEKTQVTKFQPENDPVINNDEASEMEHAANETPNDSEDEFGLSLSGDVDEENDGEALSKEFERLQKMNDQRFKDITKRINRIMTPSFKRKWSLVGRAIFSAAVKSVGSIVVGVSSANPVGIISGFASGTRAGLGKYMELKAERKDMETALEKTPLALLDVCVGFYQFIEHILVEGGYVEVNEAQLLQLYLPVERAKNIHSWLSLDPNKIVARVTGQLPEATDRTKKGQILVLAMDETELRALMDALVFLIKMKREDLTPEAIEAAGIMGYLSNSFSSSLKKFKQHFDGNNVASIFGAISTIGFEHLFSVEADATSSSTGPSTEIKELLAESDAEIANNWKSREKEQTTAELEQLGQTLYEASSTLSSEKSSTGPWVEVMSFLSPKLTHQTLVLQRYLNVISQRFVDCGSKECNKNPSLLDQMLTIRDARHEKKETSKDAEERYEYWTDIMHARRQRIDFYRAFKINNKLLCAASQAKST